MGEKYFPFDSNAGDREYRSADFAAYFGDIITSGVSANGNNLPVTATGGLTVGVGVGKAWIKGHIYENTATKSFTLTNGGSNPRIDRIVVRMNVAERKINTLVLQGTAATSPTAPALVRTDDYYDIGLAEITVPASAVAITDSNIKDTRTDTDICGVTRCLVEKLDVNSFMTKSRADFEEWLSNLKDMLDDNQAGHLQNEINIINDALHGGVYSTTAIVNLSTVPGATVEMSLGDITLTAKADEGGNAVLYPHNLGTWTLKITTANATYSGSIPIENIGIFYHAVPGFVSIAPADMDAVGAAGKAPVLFSVGDTRDIKLATGEILTIRLEDFNHDDLVSGGKAPMTFMLEQCRKDNARMGDSEHRSGWRYSEMRTSTLPSILATFPAEWRSIIKPVLKTVFHWYGNDIITDTTEDILWLPCAKEINFATNQLGYGSEGEHYPLFVGSGSRVKGAERQWWLRSGGYDSSGFYAVYKNGSEMNPRDASMYLGVCFGFCI